MSKRPPIDLMALTAEQASPMVEAVQRTAQPAKPAPQAPVGTANVIPLNFKVSAEFRKRFCLRALEADLFLNELLVEALDAWERVNGLKK